MKELCKPYFTLQRNVLVINNNDFPLVMTLIWEWNGGEGRSPALPGSVKASSEGTTLESHQCALSLTRRHLEGTALRRY